jgi:hypothetical protein
MRKEKNVYAIVSGLSGMFDDAIEVKIDDCFGIVEIEGKKFINISEHNKTARTKDVYIQNNE